jgi:hypothetical protein
MEMVTVMVMIEVTDILCCFVSLYLDIGSLVTIHKMKMVNVVVFICQMYIDKCGNGDGNGNDRSNG